MDLLSKLVEFRSHLGSLELDSASLEELRARKLRSLVQHAYRSVPYYRSLFDSAGITPSAIRSPGDLPKIPVSNKDDLRAAGIERVLARGTDPHACLRFQTSGSTGKPFEVFLSPREARTQLLIRLRALWAAGLLRPRERMVFLGPVRWLPSHLYQRLGLFRRDYVSPRLPVDAQIERLKRLKPSVLWVYPSVLSSILERVGGRLSAVIEPRAIVTNAEVAPPSLREAIRADLDVEWFNFYGAVEAGRIAWECRTHLGLHLSADTIILEAIGSPDEPTRAVVTVLDGRTMPFLRYDLGDICAYMDRPCTCGIWFPLLRAPQGRVGGLIRFSDGRTVSSWVLDSILREYLEIQRHWIEQLTTDCVVVHIVPARPLADRRVADLRGRLLHHLGDATRLEIEIGRSASSGLKHGVFLSRLD